MPIPTHECNKVELTTVIKTINSGKASGLDLIPAEVWKSGALQDQLLKVCNKAFNIGECPVIWRKAAIIPVPKKGDLTNRQNYRGISLIPIALKIYNKMLLNRLKPHLESILRTNQNGFREGRSTVGHILALRRIIEEVKINNLPAIINLIDFRKAFDSISREKLFQILASYGIPATIIRAIKAAYIHTTAQVITEDGNSNCFKIEAGVLQGDTLAPYLFIIMIDYTMRTSTNESNHLGLTISERQSRRYPATKLTDTDFADDIALFSDSREDAQSLLTLVVNAAKSVGLNINEDKTEYMTINIPNNTELQANGKTLNRVDNFKYLGSWVENTSKDLKIRKGQAWTAIRKLDNIWKSKLPRNLKINFFRATIESIFLYGAETWTLSKKLNEELDGTYTRLLRHALNINWRQHVTNIELYRNLPKISDTIRKRRLRLAGHCLRSTEVSAKLLLWKPRHGHRNPGRPKLDFATLLTEDSGLNLDELSKAMSNREQWSAITKGSGAPD